MYTKLSALSLSFAAMVSPGYAATLNIDVNGQLYGATSVEVQGKSFDVEFIDGSCAGIFSGCDSADDFVFSSLSTAEAASQALLDQVFVNGPLGLFDWRPYETLGISTTNNRYQWGYIATPYQSLNGSFSASVAHNRPSTDDGLGTMGGPVTFDFSTANDRVYAKWAPSTVSQIPLPAGLPLLAAGLSVMGFLGRFRKSKKA